MNIKAIKKKPLLKEKSLSRYANDNDESSGLDEEIKFPFKQADIESMYEEYYPQENIPSENNEDSQIMSFENKIPCSKNKNIWFWNSNSEPWNDVEKWKPYSDIENEIIEEAYQSNLEEVDIGDFRINLINFFQTRKNDSFRVRPVMRRRNVAEPTPLGLSTINEIGSMFHPQLVNTWLREINMSFQESLHEFENIYEFCFEYEKWSEKEEEEMEDPITRMDLKWRDLRWDYDKLQYELNECLCAYRTNKWGAPSPVSSKINPFLISKMSVLEEKIDICKNWEIPNYHISKEKECFYYERKTLKQIREEINKIKEEIFIYIFNSLTEYALDIESKEYNDLKKAETLKENYLKSSDFITFCKNHVMLYTHDSFWYYNLNRALRENDPSKIYFAPFCFILNSYLRISLSRGIGCHANTVYRGAELTPQQFSTYQSILDSEYQTFCWDGFISTSKTNHVYEAFGNTHFIINLHNEKCTGYDISSISKFKEDEILLPPASVFKIQSINSNVITLEKVDSKHAQHLLPQNKNEFDIDLYTSQMKHMMNYLLDPVDGIHYAISENALEMKVLIFGPPKTPYEDGIFLMEGEIPIKFPFNPPKLKFKTPIWHPNISFSSGAICMDLLEESGWSPALALMYKVILSVQSLLSEYSLDDPLELEAAQEVNEDILKFEEKARFFTKKYAFNKELRKKIKIFTDQGYIEHLVIHSLLLNEWDIEKASNTLVDLTHYYKKKSR